MLGRREGSLMRNNGSSLRGSKIAVAVAIGVLLGCVFALFYPHGFFGSYPTIQSRRISNAPGNHVRRHFLLP